MATAGNNFARRRQRVRTRIGKTAGTRPRLSVHRSSKHINAQVIDDKDGRTVAAASSLEQDLRAVTGADLKAAKAVGTLIAERAKQAGISKVIFDRGGFLYHGRVKALAEAARESGLEF